MMKANKQIGFIYKDNESIDKILKDGEVVFEKGFLREKTSTTLPINFDGVGKDLKDYKIYGNTYQNSTSGKNLRYIEDETLAGISLTCDNKSGKISIRGTATKTDGIKLSKGGGVNIPAGTYTLSVSEPLPVLINSIVSLSSSTNVAFRMPAGNTSVTVNVPSDGVLADLYFAVTKDVTYDFDFYLQLEEGSVTTEFEPFTNGASPNPGYPQEIVSCGDKTKNKFLTPNVPTESNLATYSKINKNSFTLSYNQTTAISQSPYARIDFDITQFKPNTKYTISKKHTVLGDTFNNAGGLRSYINGTNGNVINSNSLTFTTPNEISSLGVYFYLGYTNTTVGESQITFYDIQVEESSTATDYEPYGYKIPVNVRSDNLCNITNLTGYVYTNNLPIAPSDAFVINNFDSNNLSYTINNNGYLLGLSNIIELKPNTTYTLSCIRNSSENSSRTYVYNYVNNVYTLNLRVLGQGNIVFNFTTDSTGVIVLGFGVGNNSNGASGTISNIQIVEGSTVPDKYIPYYNETTNIYLDEPLRKSSDGMYTDHIDFANKKIYRQIKEITLNGTETWSRVGAKNGAYRFRSDFPDIAIGSNSVLYCTHFLNNGDTYAFEGISGAANIQIYIRWDSLFTTVEDLTTWLASNKPTVDYVLSTSTEESITLPNIPTVNGNNTLNIETEITPSQVYIKYKSNV